MATVSNISGTFNGNDLGSGLIEFLGIQFATATRFEKPIDIISYTHDVEAKAFGPQSPQAPGFMEEILDTKSIPVDENCL